MQYLLQGGVLSLTVSVYVSVLQQCETWPAVLLEQGYVLMACYLIIGPRTQHGLPLLTAGS